MPLGLVSRLKTLESLETLGGLEASRLLGRDFRDFQDQKSRPKVWGFAVKIPK